MFSLVYVPISSFQILLIFTVPELQLVVMHHIFKTVWNPWWEYFENYIFELIFMQKL